MPEKVEATKFRNRSGAYLFGTFHRPSEERPNLPLIVLLSPGVKMRVGPHAIYNRLTRSFCELGFTVFKFDFYGLGDSEGELDFDILSQLYNHIECGGCVDDTLDALDWLDANQPFQKYILGGLCGGAITGLFAMAQDSRVAGLLTFGMTVTLSGSAQDRDNHMSSGELATLRKAYLYKLLDISSWLRLLTFKSDFRVIFQTLRQKLSGLWKSRPESAKDAGNRAEPSNVNPRFGDAFMTAVQSQRHILLVYGGSDRTYWDYMEKYANPNSDLLAPYQNNISIHVIENANHVFSFRHWEEQMTVVMGDWLKQFLLSPGNSHATE